MLKYKNRIKETVRTNMKMKDVKKIVNIQWEKTLKNEKANLALTSSSNSTTIHLNKNLYRCFSNFFLGCSIIAHNFWNRLYILWFLYRFHESYFPFSKYWWRSVASWPCMYKKQMFFACNFFDSFCNAPAFFPRS